MLPVPGRISPSNDGVSPVGGINPNPSQVSYITASAMRILGEMSSSSISAVSLLRRVCSDRLGSLSTLVARVANAFLLVVGLRYSLLTIEIIDELKEHADFPTNKTKIEKLNESIKQISHDIEEFSMMIELCQNRETNPNPVKDLFCEFYHVAVTSIDEYEGKLPDLRAQVERLQAELERASAPQKELDSINETLISRMTSGVELESQRRLTQATANASRLEAAHASGQLLGVGALISLSSLKELPSSEDDSEVAELLTRKDVLIPFCAQMKGEVERLTQEYVQAQEELEEIEAKLSESKTLKSEFSIAENIKSEQILSSADEGKVIEVCDLILRELTDRVLKEKEEKAACLGAKHYFERLLWKDAGYPSLCGLLWSERRA